MEKDKKKPVARAERSKRASGEVSKVANGKRIRLSDLPLVVAQLRCGHMVRTHGITVRDIIFCDECASSTSVKHIISQ